MTHPIAQLQIALVTALAADSALTAHIGADAVFDAPPKGKTMPYVAIARHDMVPRDGDTAPGFDHRLILNVWTASPSRAAALQIAERIVEVTATQTLSSASLTVTFARIERTETIIERKTGAARAALTLRVFSEPT